MQETQETQVRSLGREDPLEKEVATHSSTLLGSPWDRGAWRATVHGVAMCQTRLSTPAESTGLSFVSCPAAGIGCTCPRPRRTVTPSPLPCDNDVLESVSHTCDSAPQAPKEGLPVTVCHGDAGEACQTPFGCLLKLKEMTIIPRLLAPHSGWSWMFSV